MEVLSDPKYLRKGVDFIYVWYGKSFWLTEKCYKNLTALKTSALKLEVRENKNELDFIRILTKLKYCKNLEITKQIIISDWTLSFLNVPILVKLNKKTTFYLKWKKFICFVNIAKLNENFWFTK